MKLFSKKKYALSILTASLLITPLLNACFSGTTNLISFNDNEEKILNVGETFQLTFSQNIEEEVQFISSNPEVASVTETGVVKALKEGETTIKVSNSTSEDSIKIIVKKVNLETNGLRIVLDNSDYIVGKRLPFEVKDSRNNVIKNPKINFLSGSDLVEFSDGYIRFLKHGTCSFKAEYQDLISDTLTIEIVDFLINIEKNTIREGNSTKITLKNYADSLDLLSLKSSDDTIVSLIKNADGTLEIKALQEGSASFSLVNNRANNIIYSNTLHIDVIPENNPYANITTAEFYENYTPATSYIDAMYRSEYQLMSGKIDEQDQKPTIATNQPKKDKKLIRNTGNYFSNNNKTYTVVDKNGNKAFEVYEGAAYVVLEEVAAYIYAFGDIPINYTANKSGSPASSPWGKYLRLNHSFFKGDTNKYPYEPYLPDISGCGGNLEYYELDIGTTGTDCDPSMKPKIYNDGNKITRGAARIVYSRYYLDSGVEVSPKDRYVFYTYNHYNDFQEYLNYENGWGEIFGNITGGGELSSNDKNKVNPTPYVETYRGLLN